jgi:hypothetical protein
MDKFLAPSLADMHETIAVRELMLDTGNGLPFNR